MERADVLNEATDMTGGAADKKEDGKTAEHLGPEPVARRVFWMFIAKIYANENSTMKKQCVGSS